MLRRWTEASVKRRLIVKTVSCRSRSCQKASEYAVRSSVHVSEWLCAWCVVCVRVSAGLRKCMRECIVENLYFSSVVNKNKYILFQHTSRERFASHIFLTMSSQIFFFLLHSFPVQALRRKWEFITLPYLLALNTCGTRHKSAIVICRGLTTETTH